MSKLAAILTAAAVMVTGAVVGGELVSAGAKADVQQITVEPVAPAVEYEGPGTDTVPTTPAVEYEGPGTDIDPAEPRYECRELYGRQVCDTFGESDEGPGTR